MGRAPRLSAITALTWLLVVSSGARAEAVDHFEAGTQALAAGKFDESIDHFEAHADAASSHPDASFNRGLAYVLRIKSGAEKPGDLGRAGAAFAEALAMRSSDEDALHALELVHGEVARRRAHRGKDAVVARPTLDRVVVGLASERAWGVGAMLSSLLLATGLVMRRRVAGTIHLAGTLLAPASAVALLLLTPLYMGAWHLRLHTRPGVLVVKETHLTDDAGVSRGTEPIPEAALLEVGERNGRLVHVRYGSVEGWVPAAAVWMLRTE